MDIFLSYFKSNYMPHNFLLSGPVRTAGISLSERIRMDHKTVIIFIISINYL